MHILVTNDDGVYAPGLLALVRALRELGEITVFAPDRNWSASGHVKTLHRSLRVDEVELADGSPALATDGAPSDCVALAVLGIVKKHIDLVVSGINPHSNLGHDVTYSGTVTAAMEAAIWHMPGIAVSTEYDDEIGYGPAAQVGLTVAREVGERGLPDNTLLNVNVPTLSVDQMKGIRITRQGLRVYEDELVTRDDPRGRPYYWIGGKPPSGIVEDGTDFGELSEGWVSVTPLQLDLTAHALVKRMSTWRMEICAE